MMIETVAQLLAALPEKLHTFEGSAYPLPLCQAVLGRLPEISEIADAARSDDGDVGHHSLHVAMAAECYEAAHPDADDAFVKDARLRSMVFMGGKWRAGWTFILGDESETIVPSLEQRNFMVQVGGPRATWPVYWLQMMVRYAMIWGQIPPGEDHEMGHLLEEDLPGVLIVRGRCSELECVLAMAMMKLGCPAVVPHDFPFEEGRQARVHTEEEALNAIATLPNMRVREQEGVRTALPDYCNPARAKEPFEAASTIGGGDSFLLLRPGQAGDGIEIIGDPTGGIGVLIEVGDPRLAVATSAYVERTALALPDYMEGVRVLEKAPLTVGLAAGVSLDPAKLANALHAGLRWHFPRLQDIHVKLVFEPDELARESTRARQFERERERIRAEETEAGVDLFVSCIECQTFTHRHVCIVTPGRPPMCGRDPDQVRAAALFGATWHPYLRRGLKAQDLREMVDKGRCIDPLRGEYEGVNEAVRRLSDGAIQRVYLHSLRDFPHSSCGCFHYLAFEIEGCGIGIMDRSFPGKAPNGETWDSLANRAGGKQTPGITGISAGYLRSPDFLKADGGLKSVVWVTAKVMDQIEDLLPGDRGPATEQDAASMEELRAYISQG